MAGLDPVPWEDVEAVSGAPAADVTAYVDRLRAEVAGEPPAFAVERVYDAWKAELGSDRDTPDQGAAFVIAYLLEREGTIEFDEAWGPGSPAGRRPAPERLAEWFWDREWTLWWIGVRLGVHYSLVTYWLWEDDIPLAERNLTEDVRERVAERRWDDRPE